MAEHRPVLLQVVLDWLRCRSGGLFVDCTAGLGGHSEGLLQCNPSTQVLAIDRDCESLEQARERLRYYGSRVRFVCDNFKNLPALLESCGWSEVDGILVDLGVSSAQLEEAERGFSFLRGGPLDMRMDRRQDRTAADLIAQSSEQQLADLFYRYGEERRARSIARAIVNERGRKPITTTAELSRIVEKTNPRASRTHPATRVFQALRIAVNDELHGLDAFIRNAVLFLKPGSRIALISFHSLEDRIVKTTLRELAGYCVCDRPAMLCSCPRQPVVQILTSKPVVPDADELADNPRARSAKLRVAERLAGHTTSPME